MTLKAQAKLFTKNLVGIGEINDFELMQLVSEGNHMAFEQIYKTHKKGLYNFILNFTKGDKEMTDEVLQEAFMRLHTRAIQFQEGNKISSWLYTIAKNLTIDTYRKKDALNFQYDIKGEDGEIKNVEELSVETTHSEEILLQKLQKNQVDHCVQKLKDRQREAVSYRMFSELSYEEVAEIMETTVSSIKSLLNRAKKSLFTCLKEFTHDEE